ncbi:MAG: cation:proton antiporter [Anaerolineae bacterium]|nr:cation:proton antiporter [Anaerolineae bacterium]
MVYFTDSHLDASIVHLGELGVLLLMFIAGLDLHLSDLAKSGKVSAYAGTLGVLFPLGLGYLAAVTFDNTPQQSLFIGLILAATSVSISAQTFIELRVLRTRVGIGMLGAAVFDDILVVLGLSIFIALTGDNPSGLQGVLLIAVKMIAYLIIAVFLGVRLFPRLGEWFDSSPISQGLIAFVFVTTLFYAWSAEVLGGLAAITGAFLAGLLFARTPVKDTIEKGFSTIAYGVFVPIFFVNVGLSANARELSSDGLWFLLVLSLVAIVSKILGSGLGARMSGFNNLEALQLGVGMMSRGEVGLIVATVGITEGLITQELFSSIIGVVIITTLLTPPILRMLFAKPTSPTTSRGEKSKQPA